MYIKVVTTKIKPKHRRAKKVYRYVKVIGQRYNREKWRHDEFVVASLGTIDEVSPHVDTLCKGLQQLGRKRDLSVSAG